MKLIITYTTVWNYIVTLMLIRNGILMVYIAVLGEKLELQFNTSNNSN